jgi:hypothetical protein
VGVLNIEESESESELLCKDSTALGTSTVGGCSYFTLEICDILRTADVHCLQNAVYTEPFYNKRLHVNCLTSLHLFILYVDC